MVLPYRLDSCNSSPYAQNTIYFSFMLNACDNNIFLKQFALQSILF